MTEPTSSPAVLGQAELGMMVLGSAGAPLDLVPSDEPGLSDPSQELGLSNPSQDPGTSNPT